MPDTQTTDRELWVLAGYLHEAYQQAEPGHRLLAAAQAADQWAHDRYHASIDLLRQHAEMTEKIRRLESDQERRESEQWVQGVVYDQALEMLQAAEDRAESLTELLASLEWRGVVVVYRGEEPYRVQSCPSCRGLNPHQHPPWMNEFAINWGHKPDCALKAALEGREAADGEDPVDEDQRLARYAVTQLKRAARLEPRVMPPDDYPPHHASYGCMPPRSASAHDRAAPLSGAGEQRAVPLEDYHQLETMWAKQRETIGHLTWGADDAAKRIRDLTERAETAEDRAASLADRVMAAEGERDKAQKQVEDLLAQMEDGAAALEDATALLGKQGAEIQRLRGRVSELDAQLRDAEHDLHVLGPDYADLMTEHGALKRKTARLADYDHQAEQAETYRRLYAQTLAELEEVQGGERSFTWIPFSEREPHDGYLVELMPGWQQVIWHTGANRGTATHWREVQHGE